MKSYGYQLSEVMQTNRFDEHCSEIMQYAEGLTEEDAIGVLNTLSEEELIQIRLLAEEIPAYAFLWSQLGKLGGGLARKVSGGWGAAKGQGFMKQLGGAWQGAKDWAGGWNKAIGASVAKAGKDGKPGSLGEGVSRLWTKMGDNNPTLAAKKNVATGFRQKAQNIRQSMATGSIKPTGVAGSAYSNEFKRRMRAAGMPKKMA